MAAIRVLIADDEPLARQRIQTLLEHEDDIAVVAECADGLQAVAAVEEHKPDLLFLDVQMPALDGFGVLEALEPAERPVVIFVTAHDHYALRAFDVHALDYLLKPYDRDRFHKALERARAEIRGSERGRADSRLTSLVEEVKARRPVERLLIKSAGRVYFVRVEEIWWIEASGNYARLHAGSETHLLRETMNGLEMRLDPQRFLRIHRSTIVNIERIKELHPWFHGDYQVVLHDGTELTLSRSYRPRLQELFGDTL
jgi:two-component system, LytTR family, response regulator